MNMDNIMRAPSKISTAELSHHFSTLLAKALLHTNNLLAVTDKIPDEFFEAVPLAGESPQITVHLTRKAAQSYASNRVRLCTPYRELPGTIGSLFVVGNSAIFRLNKDWYCAEDDPELAGMLVKLGSVVVEYTQYEETE